MSFEADDIDQFDAFEDKEIIKHEEEFEIYTYDQLLTLQQDQIHQIAETLNIDSPIARLLLSYFQWNTEKIINIYFEYDLAHILKLAKISNDLQHDEPIGDKFECPTCYDDVITTETRQYMCGHRFCKSCWKQHITVKLDEGITKINCMNSKCGVFLDENFIYEFLDPVAREKFSKKIAEAVVEENAHLKWCSSVPSCGHIACAKNKDAIIQIYCPCGHSFCFHCYDDSHIPCTCFMLKAWRKQCKDDSMTVEWLKTHAKDCPKCGKYIEKNGGCNHISCKCGHHFCFVCLGDFDPKTYKHTCKKFEEDSTQSANALKRYLHYYSRYKIHEESRNKESQIREKIQQKIIELYHNKNYASWFDNQWLSNGMEILFLCRRILQYSYVFAYYLFDGAINKDALRGVREMNKDEVIVAKNLFENLQELLENRTEKLSSLIENPIDVLEKIQQEILSCSIEAEKRMNALIATIKNEILDLTFGFNVLQFAVVTKMDSGSRLLPQQEKKREYEQVIVKDDPIEPPKKSAKRKETQTRVERPRLVHRPKTVEIDEEDVDETFGMTQEEMELQRAIHQSMFDK